MVGAILGDIIGSPFEFDMGDKTKKFDLFTEGCEFTDDTVMTIAVAEALMEAGPDADVETIKKCCIKSMKKWGQKYPNSGFGARFIHWVLTDDPQPYGSYGNGSAMRVSPAGWLYDSIERTREVAKATAEVSHNHPEGIKGAEATASVIYLARTGASKDEIKQYVIDEFGYDLSRTLDEIRPGYYHVETCMKTVPEAITAFLEGENFEDVVRNVVSLGGDTDTLGAIAGAMAEAFYGVPDDLEEECMNRIPEEMRDIVLEFNTVLLMKEADAADTSEEMQIFSTLWSMSLGDGNKRMNGESPLPDKFVTATKDSWQIVEMPEEYSERPCQIKLSEEEFQIIKKGHIPEVMEDHWFMYCDTETHEIRYYRSWTGMCIFAAEYLEFENDGAVIYKIKTNRNKEQYDGNDRADWFLFNALIDAELGKDDSRDMESYINCLLGR